MKVKLIIFIGAVIFIAALIYYASLIEDKDPIGQTSFSSLNIENSDKSKNKNVKNRKIEEALKINKTPESINFEDLNTVNKTSSRCGFTSEKFYNTKMKVSISEMTVKQLNAYEQLEKKCLQWYDYLNTLTFDEREDIVDAKKKWTKEFYTYSFPEPSLKMTNKVIKQLKNGISEKNNLKIVEMQILYLLMHDYELHLKIAGELRTSDPSFIRSSAGYITSLFMCEYSNDCEPNGDIMLNFCISDATNCGMSYIQYLQSISTFGQFSDWQNVVVILRELINSDWFSDRNVINP
jgi:hypothetical protein